jgi:hypothetical protein
MRVKTMTVTHKANAHGCVEKHGTSYNLGSTWCGIRQLASGMLMLAGTNAAPVAKQNFKNIGGNAA